MQRLFFNKQRPEFVESGWRLFAGRLRNLRDSVTKKKGFAAADAAALTHDRHLFPVCLDYYWFNEISLFGCATRIGLRH